MDGAESRRAGGPGGLALAWRHALLAGAAVGLAVSPLAGHGSPVGATPAAQVLAGAVAAVLLGVARPGGGRAQRFLWLGLLALAAVLVGIGIGAVRLEAIDGGALDLEAGARVEIEGTVASVPRRAEGEVRVQVETPSGRLLIEAREPVGELAVGRRLGATGVVRDPEEWERSYLERQGIAVVLAARDVDLENGGRGGLAGALDEVRTRAETALGRGTTPEAASLLRGFVLGQDDRIDAATREEFKRSGLAHLLAVSGQNVILLALLAGAAFAVIGLPRRSRLFWILALIAVYVPVAGAGPSIQRAGVMGAAGLVAALASRPASRVYALLLAAVATLALNPRASADVGWQLSFAAVLGILVLVGPIRSLLIGDSRGAWRSALAEGAAVTVAATFATAPLMALHFGVVSLASLPANLLALPAVAPVMWLGMLAAAAGQLGWMPVEPLTELAGVLAGFIAQVAEWFSAPGWAQRDVELGGPWTLALAYAALGLVLVVGLRVVARRRALRPTAALVGRRASGVSGGSRAWRIAAAAVLVLIAALAGLSRRSETTRPSPEPGLTVSVLDVGQGDSILLEPADGQPVLVDAGPSEADVAGMLGDRGIERLAALVVTHPQADHAGGAAAVLRELEVGQLIFAAEDRLATRAAAIAGTRTHELARGAALRSGALRVEVLWPPAEASERGSAPIEDPNALSLVLLARWRYFEILLTGDAEAEAVPIDPGPVDVLKVAHHGSVDTGLPELLARTSPELAVISAGAGNPYGHPAAATLEMLGAAGVPTLRTDLQGELALEATRGGWAVR